MSDNEASTKTKNESGGFCPPLLFLE